MSFVVFTFVIVPSESSVHPACFSAGVSVLSGVVCASEKELVSTASVALG